MNKLLKLFLLLFLIFCMTLQADPEIVIQLRLYEGFSKTGAPSGVIVSSYYLQKIPGDNILPFVEVTREKEKLIKIYHLKDVRQIASLDMVLKKKDIRIHKHDLALNGKKIAIQLGRISQKSDRFKVSVIEQSPDAKPLMETEIIMPQNKTAVLGFKPPTSIPIMLEKIPRKKSISLPLTASRMTSMPGVPRWSSPLILRRQ